jgi:two-component system chemotaxis sensor kinase CheA
MDVVRTNIELLEGSLTIDSRPGVGTAMILRMPLTLAIIPCLVVTVDGERHAIPRAYASDFSGIWANTLKR